MQASVWIARHFREVLTAHIEQHGYGNPDEHIDDAYRWLFAAFVVASTVDEIAATISGIIGQPGRHPWQAQKPQDLPPHRVQKEGEVVQVVTDHLIDLSDLATGLVRIDGLDGIAITDPVFPAARNFR